MLGDGRAGGDATDGDLVRQQPGKLRAPGQAKERMASAAGRSEQARSIPMPPLGGDCPGQD